MDEFEEAVRLYLQQNPGATRPEAEQAVTEQMANANTVSGVPENPIYSVGVDPNNFLALPDQDNIPKEQNNRFLSDSDREYYRRNASGDDISDERVDELAAELAEFQRNQRLRPSGFGDGQYSGIGLGAPGSVSLESKAASIGRFAGLEKGTKGKGLGLLGSIGGFLLGSARTITSNYAAQKANKIQEDWIRDQQRRTPRYTAAPQTRDANYLGGLLYHNGGEHRTGDSISSLPESINPDSTTSVEDTYFMRGGGYYEDKEMYKKYLNGDIVGPEDPPQDDDVLPRQKRGAFTTNKAHGDINWFLEKRQKQLERQRSNLAIVEINPEDGSDIYVGTTSDPDQIDTGSASIQEVTGRESRRLAREINKRNRELYPGRYQKIKPNAFKSKGESSIVSLRDGGTFNFLK